MPPLLHDAAVRESIRARVQRLNANTERKWGKMTVDQMLWHVNQALLQSLGRIEVRAVKTRLPQSFLRFAVINVPWPKGSPTSPDLVADLQRCDFASERTRCLELIDSFAAKSIDSEWPLSGTLGRMSGRQWSQLHAKHLNHHLKQFNV